MTDEELLAELQPLAQVILDKVRTVPVRHCPGGTDDLVSELTLAIALYVGRHVLPAEAAELRNPPIPARRWWVLQTQSAHTGEWRPYSAPYDEATDAHADFNDTVAHKGNVHRTFRVLRSATTYAVEAEYSPEQSS
ncbi:hypothetical protein ACFY3G_02855 [Streptomyces phaeochromogenes]|uniref:hypothetical protein n=1 Tax=Streptomyces phaeochromogenes TaxID=1923 RepID=UPI00367C58EB